MPIGDEMAERLTGFTIHVSGRLTSKLLASLIQGFMEKIGSLSLLEKHGEQSLHSLSKEHKTDYVELNNSDVAGFKKAAKESGLDYSLCRHRNDSEKYTLFIRTKDIDKLDTALRYTLTQKGIGQDSQTLEETISKAQEKAKEANKAKQAVKQVAKKRGKEIVR